jgi:hypothetical protein
MPVILATPKAENRRIDHSSNPAQAISFQDPVSKIPIKKRVGRVAQGEAPVPQKNKKKEWRIFVPL